MWCTLVAKKPLQTLLSSSISNRPSSNVVPHAALLTFRGFTQSFFSSNQAKLFFYLTLFFECLYTLAKLYIYIYLYICVCLCVCEFIFKCFRNTQNNLYMPFNFHWYAEQREYIYYIPSKLYIYIPTQNKKI